MAMIGSSEEQLLYGPLFFEVGRSHGQTFIEVYRFHNTFDQPTAVEYGVNTATPSP